MDYLTDIACKAEKILENKSTEEASCSYEVPRPVLNLPLPNEVANTINHSISCKSERYQNAFSNFFMIFIFFFL